MTTVLQAVNSLLAVCDGAVSRDDQGFNKFDSAFVRSVLSKNRDLTERQELAIFRILKKYQGQLSRRGIVYDQLQLVAKKIEIQPGEPMVLDYIDDPRLPLFKLHSRISFAKQAKALPTSYWHQEDKTWTYSPTIPFFEAVQPYLKDGTIKDTAAASLILVDLARARKRLQTVQNIKGQEGPVTDSTMPTKVKPFTHQVKAFQIGTTVNEAALLMEQGTGKTLSAICIAGYRYTRKEVQRLLVIAPLSVTSVWKDEFSKIATFPYDIKTPVEMKKDLPNFFGHFQEGCLQVIIINYESSWRVLEALLKWKPQMIIADESQKIKNGRAKQSKALHKLGDQASYKLILSGTPITQGPLDTWSQYRFLNPTVFGRKFLRFRDQYAIMGGYMGYQVTGYKNLPELAEKAHSIAYRVTKAEALDLPEQVDQIIKVKLEPEAADLYKKMEEDFIIKFSEDESATAPIILTQLLRLQQITGGFIPVDETGLMKNLSMAKLEMVADILEDLPSKKKVVIFARFTAEIEALKQVMGVLKRKFVTISGDTKDRAAAVKSFQEDPAITILISQIQTGGLGITLTASDTVIFYSTTFSFADYEQAKARIHRIGQAHSVTYIHILVEDSVDEDILKILKSKGNMAKLIVDTLSRKFSKKPFTSSSNRDIINLIETKEDSEMTEETKGTTTTAPETDAKADLKNKLAKIKKSSEAKAPSAKKVAEKPHVEKNKVKDTKAEKKEKKVSKTSNPKLILLKDLAAEAGLNPRDVRKVLRKTFKRPEGSSWSWEKGDSELAAVKAELKKIAKAASKK